MSVGSLGPFPVDLSSGRYLCGDDDSVDFCKSFFEIWSHEHGLHCVFHVEGYRCKIEDFQEKYGVRISRELIIKVAIR